ncbi:MAG TPA: hypothetical protein VFO98_07690 [Marmoricola sp.]|nr:hypothetical protein [Marmoricola sp.]
MGDLTADPFATYRDEYGVSAADIRTATEDAKLHATELSMLVRDLHVDGTAAVDRVTDLPGSLSASGLFATAVLDHLADQVQAHDADVRHLNAEYHHRMRHEAGTSAGTSLAQYLAPPVLVEVDPEQVREGILADLRPRYQRLRGLLEDQVELVARMLREGPGDRYVRLLASTGCLPLAMMYLFPRVVLTLAERQQAMRFVETPEDLWGLIDPAAVPEWCRAVAAPEVGTLPLFPLTKPTDLSGAGTGYYGGGFITGPDGRRYPLVVPVLSTDQGPVLAARTGDRTVDDLDGRDSGWHTLTSQRGIDLFGERTDTLEKVITGLGPRPGGSGPDVAAGRPVGAPEDIYVLPDGRPVPAGASRADRSSGGLQLLTDSVRPIAVTQRLDDNQAHAYHVTYQENDDGRRRALLNTYDVLHDAEGRVDVRWSRSYVDAGGDLVQVPVRQHHQRPALVPEH